jgi:hypothetical protein
MNDVYARILQSVVIQAVKDYKGKITTNDSDYQTSVLAWVEQRLGTFDLCAVALDMTETELQMKLLETFDKIDEKRGYKRIKRNDAKPEGKEVIGVFHE